MAEEIKQPPEPEEAPDNPTPESGRADKEAAFAGPAVLANRFFATITPGGMRIAFTEIINPGEPPAFRSAVFVNYGDAMALADLIKNMMAQYVREVPISADDALRAATKKPDGDKK